MGWEVAIIGLACFAAGTFVGYIAGITRKPL